MLPDDWVKTQTREQLISISETIQSAVATGQLRQIFAQNLRALPPNQVPRYPLAVFARHARQVFDVLGSDSRLQGTVCQQLEHCAQPISVTTPDLVKRSSMLADLLTKDSTISWDPSMPFSRNTLERVIRYCENGGLGSISLEQALDLLRACTYLDVKLLQRLLEECLAPMVRQNTFFKIYDAAAAAGATYLQRFCISYIWQGPNLSRTSLEKRNLHTNQSRHQIYISLPPGCDSEPVCGYLDRIGIARDVTVESFKFHSAALKLMRQETTFKGWSRESLQILHDWIYEERVNFIPTAEQWLQVFDLLQTTPIIYYPLRRYAQRNFPEPPYKDPFAIRRLADAHYTHSWSSDYAKNWDLYSWAPKLTTVACLRPDTPQQQLKALSPQISHLYCFKDWTLDPRLSLPKVNAVTVWLKPKTPSWMERARNLDYLSCRHKLPLDHITRLLAQNHNLNDLHLRYSDLSQMNLIDLPLRLTHLSIGSQLPWAYLPVFAPSLEVLECPTISDDDQGETVASLPRLQRLAVPSLGPRTFNACLTHCPTLRQLISPETDTPKTIDGKIVAIKLQTLQVRTITDDWIVGLTERCIRLDLIIGKPAHTEALTKLKVSLLEPTERKT
jgi:hypothetical protein